jgi:tetratricopeptide (TPR) repeat protein
MSGFTPEQEGMSEDANNRFRWAWRLFGGAVLVILIAVLFPRPEKEPAERSGSTNASTSRIAATSHSNTRRSDVRHHWNLPPGLTAEEVVTNKVSQFARSRREVLHNLAKHLKLEVPAEFDKFFDAVEAGNWDRAHDLFEALKKIRYSTGTEAMAELWPVLTQTYGVAEAAHTWPAQQLLDYGQAVLGSLRSGMVYFGGNDAGLYIPTLLNETSESERHIILSQNAFADASYLQYVSFLYSDRLATLTSDESQRGFQNYLTDAQKRLQHDQQFPNEPRQIRPGEDVRMSENRVQVSGQVAVTAINEKLFQTLMDKNPNMSFAINQSWVPFQSTYANAVPLGPILELRNQEGLTPERAVQAVDYWRTTTRQLHSDPEVTGSSPVLLAYGEMASNQAALLLERKYVAEAEQTFRMATELLPANPAVLFRYVSFLTGQNRFDDAIPLVQNAANLAPDNKQFRDLLAHLQNQNK